MAITIISVPRSYAPVYNKMVYTASSTNVGNTAFKYLVDIYVNGLTPKIVRLRIPPRPDNYLEVDIHRVLEQSITFYLLSMTNVLGSVDADTSLMTYTIKFGEEYDVAGTITQFPDLTVDATRYAINGSLGRNELIDYQASDYLASLSVGNYLSNAPLIQKTTIEDFGGVSIFNYIGQVNRLILATYDETETIIGQFRIAVATGGDLITVPSNPASLNLIQAVDFITGTQPIITSAVHRYRFYFSDATDALMSPLMCYDIQKCGNKARLIFQNRLGQFDSFNFTKRKDTKTAIERKTFKMIPNRLSAGGVYTESKSDKEKIQHYTKTTDSIKVVSDWITEDENNWLLELVESPIIYLEENGERIAIEKVTKTSHDTKNSYQDKLFNMELELTLGYDNYRQRG